MHKSLSALFPLLLAISCTAPHPKEQAVETLPCQFPTDTLPKVIDGHKRMVLIPSGEFLMGSENGTSAEQPVRKLEMSAFYIDETPVTYADFQEYVNDGGSVTRYWAYSSYNIPEQPISGISWYHAVNYCNWRSVKEGLRPSYIPTGQKDKWGLDGWKLDSVVNGYRLPSEAEWEYAARGGLEQKDFPWGDEFEDTWANYDTDKGQQLSEWWRLATVKSQKPNAYGLYGMAGNVWEWCEDWYDERAYNYGGTCNPITMTEGSARVVRGGGWGSPSPDYLKVYKRSFAAPSNFNYSIGFRCVRGAFSKPEGKGNVSGFTFFRYPNAPELPLAVEDVDFFSESFTKKLGDYLADNFPECLYFQQDVDGQPKTTPHALAQLIVDESQAAKINPLFVTSIMISESGFATVSFPRWFNNPMAYHWQNKLMEKGLPTYDADKSHNRKYKDLRAAIQNYSKIRRDIYFERAAKDLYSFHLLYVGYEAEEWMYTIGKVFREVANVHISPTEPTEHVGRYIYTDWQK